MNRKKQAKKDSIQHLTAVGVMTGIMCVLAPLTVPVGPVPISLMNLILFFALYILGRNRAIGSYLTYLLLGMVGLPVFSGFTSGPGKLFGPTGGYLIGFLPMLYVTGTLFQRFCRKRWSCFAAMLLGCVICDLFGTVWLSVQANLGFGAAIATGVIPFIPGDLLKIAAAAWAGPQICRQLRKANL